MALHRRRLRFARHTVWLPTCRVGGRVAAVEEVARHLIEREAGTPRRAAAKPTGQ